MRTYHIAWWNLENLFDEENAVALGRRTDKVFRAVKNDIAGWTAQLPDREIDQLATVIAAMNTGNGPDLLGVCEVETRFVVDRLVERVNATLLASRSYEVVHADTGGARGIDVGFIYDDTLFQVPLPLEGSVFFHVVMRRNATREIAQVNFQDHDGRRKDLGRLRQPLDCGSGGQFESEGYRAIAGGDAQLFPPAGPRGARTPATGARDG
jgi:Endonuclease/Exonuclease/phosphatase family